MEEMDEISLRECVETVLKNIKMIVAVTAVFIVLGLIVAFAMPKTYEATATLLTNPINSSTTVNTDSLSGLIDSTSQYSHMDVTTYVEQILNTDTLTKTIQELNITNDKGEYVSVESFRNKIEIENPEDTNLIYVTVTDKDPEMASSIANTICKYFAQYISELTRAQGLASAESIKTQMDVEKANLDEEAKKLRDYLTNSKSIDLLNSEISSVMSLLTSYKSSLLSLETSIEVQTAELKKLLEALPENVNLKLNDLEVNLSSGSFEFKLQDNNEIQDAMLTMQITNLQTSLNSNIIQQKAYQERVTELEKELVELQSTLAEEQYAYNAIQRDYNLAQSTYTTYQDKYKEATIAAASDIGRVSIQVASSATIPEENANISKALILLVAAVLGGMISVFAAFFKEYWKSTETKNVK